MEDFRKAFDLIPEHFDRWRQRYCSEAFEDIINYSGLSGSKSVLEIGPGTGQATEPILKTGCDYLAVELGEHLAEFCTEKFAGYENFRIVNDDFVTRDFGSKKFDLVFSAATIQWIPEKIGFPKVFDLLKDGGSFAMMFQKGDYKTPNEDLFNRIQEVYSKYFHPENVYTCKLGYENVVSYGFTDLDRREYHFDREFTADEWCAFIATHCDHIVLKDPERTCYLTELETQFLKPETELSATTPLCCIW